MRTRLVAGSLFVSLVVLTTWAQTPLGAAFTYQGRLNQSGQPYNGVANLIFKLYDASVGGKSALDGGGNGGSYLAGCAHASQADLAAQRFQICPVPHRDGAAYHG